MILVTESPPVLTSNYQLVSLFLSSPRSILLAGFSHSQTFIFQELSQSLRKQTRRSVGPQGFLYVNQREIAGTTPEDGKSVNSFHLYFNR
jgi:hypothetical protein